MDFVWIAILWAQSSLWKAEVGSNARIELLPDGNILVLTDKRAYALNSATGASMWQYSYPRPLLVSTWRPIGSYPLWEVGSLAPLGAPSDSGSQSFRWGEEGYLVLNAANGRLVFDSRATPNEWAVIRGRAVVPQSGLLVVFGDGPKDPKKFMSLQVSLLAGYDLRTGQQRWRRPSGDKPAAEGLYSNLLTYDGKIYYLTNRALYAVDASDGRTLWRTEIVKGLSLRAMTGTYLFVEEEKDWIVAFGRGRVIAVRRSDGQPVWSSPINVPRDNVLQSFSTSQGILIFTDDLQPGSAESATGRNLFFPPLALLLSYETGSNLWGERLKTPGLLAGYIPLDENRLLCLFHRERPRGGGRSPVDDWAVEVDVLNIKQGTFLFRRPITLKGAFLHAQTVPGGFLVQTARRLQYISEEGQVLWEKSIKRPFQLPFAVREEGGLFQAFLIDETGQLFRWDGPGTEPQAVGNRLSAFQQDPPQGIAYDNGKIWVWGGSTLYGLTPEGRIDCEFRRPVPAQPAALRILGVTLSVAGYITSAYLGYKALQTVSYDPERPGDRPDVATSLRKILTATGYGLGAATAALLADAAWIALVEARRTRMKEVEHLVFLTGMEGRTVTVYGIDKLKCSVIFQKSLGSLGLFHAPQYEVDPLDRRLYVVENGVLSAYSLLPE
ncbi:MAG: PQQ-binding-like beta-propeller repeat protein [Bacteroidia bacterium]|nr:PQQ-binding-like beta-propeller repeat protein [Bacteroidia bacterium]